MNTPTEQPRVITDPRIYIGCPAYGSLIHVGFACSLMDSLRLLKCLGDLRFFGGDSLVSRARNNIASFFLNGHEGQDDKGAKVIVKYEWLLFIDTDLIFNPADIQMLYDLATKRGPGIYAGTYPLKKLRPQIVFNAVPGHRPDADGIVRVSEAGTGFMLIHRSVLEKMKTAYPENDYNSDNGDMGGPNATRHDWFQVGVKRDVGGNKPRYLSEDWFFCQKWTDMGGQILMHTRICAHHIGQFTFPPNPQEIIEVADIYKETIRRQQEAAAKKDETVAAAA